MSKTDSGVHRMWAVVVLTLGVGVLVALTRGSADDVTGAMLTTALLGAFFLLF